MIRALFKLVLLPLKLLKVGAKLIALPFKIVFGRRRKRRFKRGLGAKSLVAAAAVGAAAGYQAGKRSGA